MSCDTQTMTTVSIVGGGLIGPEIQSRIESETSGTGVTVLYGNADGEGAIGVGQSITADAIDDLLGMPKRTLPSAVVKRMLLETAPMLDDDPLWMRQRSHPASPKGRFQRGSK